MIDRLKRENGQPQKRRISLLQRPVVFDSISCIQSLVHNTTVMFCCNLLSRKPFSKYTEHQINQTIFFDNYALIFRLYALYVPPCQFCILIITQTTHDVRHNDNAIYVTSYCGLLGYESCSLIGEHQHFGGIYSFKLQGSS